MALGCGEDGDARTNEEEGSNTTALRCLGCLLLLKELVISGQG